MNEAEKVELMEMWKASCVQMEKMAASLQLGAQLLHDEINNDLKRMIEEEYEKV